MTCEVCGDESPTPVCEECDARVSVVDEPDTDSDEPAEYDLGGES